MSGLRLINLLWAGERILSDTQCSTSSVSSAFSFTFLMHFSFHQSWCWYLFLRFFSPIDRKTVKSLKWWAYATCVHAFVCVSLLFARTQTLCWCTTWMYRRWMTAGSHAALFSAPSTPTGKSGQSGARRSSLDNSSPCVSSLCISTYTTFLLLSSTQVFSPRAFTKFGSAANHGSVSFHLSCSSNTGKDAEEPRQAWKWISRQLVWNI